MKTQNAGNKGLKLEDISLGHTYTLTINPASQPNKWLKKDINIWYRKIYAELLQYKLDIHIELWMESSPTGRLHFHGMICPYKYITLIKFLNEVSVWAHYEIDTISPCVNDCYKYDTAIKHSEKCGEQIWHIYCHKQQKVMKDIFESIVNYPMVINVKSEDLTDQPITNKRGRTKAKPENTPPKGLSLFGYEPEP